jgi:protein-S-isoprenylcysteine O-methyltransferase
MSSDPMVVVQVGGLLLLLLFYHVAEYCIQKYFHPGTTDYTSFLITREYLIAFGFGLTEYLLERYFFPSKSNPKSIFFCLGVLCVVVGLAIRFTAIFTAQKSFTHLVAETKEEEHVLVTDGIYRYFRHPGYFGFYLFAVGTQLALKNPISIVLYIVILWMFFNDRICDEEKYLVAMFKDYRSYRDRTPTWIPFIK